MYVWIIFKNGKVDAVFDNEESAKNHAKNAAIGWNIIDTIKMELRSF